MRTYLYIHILLYSIIVNLSVGNRIRKGKNYNQTNQLLLLFTLNCMIIQPDITETTRVTIMQTMTLTAVISTKTIDSPCCALVSAHGVIFNL